MAEEIAECTPEGKYCVGAQGLQEVVAHKDTTVVTFVRKLAEATVRSYIAEPERGARNWEGRH